MPKTNKKLAAAKSAAIYAAARAVVSAGICPSCGAGLKRNSSITGWYQCAQYGAIGFRADSAAPGCSWQAFTE